MTKYLTPLVWLLPVILATIGLVALKRFHLGNAHAKTFEVQLAVDFGPANKPAHQEIVEVEQGTTAKDAVSQVFPIRSGKSCCSLREVIEIDGVAIDPAKSWWWTCSVNGSRKGVTPHRIKLKPGDLVEWKYVQSVQ